MRRIDGCAAGILHGNVEGAGRHVLSPCEGACLNREQQAAGHDRARNSPNKHIDGRDYTARIARVFPAAFRPRFELAVNHAQQTTECLRPHIFASMNCFWSWQ